MRPSRKLPPGTELRPPDVDGDDLVVVMGDDLGEGRRHVELRIEGDELAVLERHGEMPLPPYITEPLDDPERYQTVFSQRAGSAAAPTAGLHLTPEVLARLAERGVERAEVELVVGLGTFRPIAADVVEDHVMHAERYRVPAETMAACERTRAAGGQGRGRGHHRGAGAGERRGARASSTGAPTCSSRPATSSGSSTGCSPTSTCPARRCS